MLAKSGHLWLTMIAALFVAIVITTVAMAEPADPAPSPNDRPENGGTPQAFQRRGPGGPMDREPILLLDKHDRDKSGHLDAAERKAARESLAKESASTPDRERRMPFSPGPGRGNRREAPEAGPEIKPGDVDSYPGKDLYDSGVIRTLFLTFDSEDWEKELEDFHGTDVDVPATLTVDGKTYADVGVRFRGMSSYMMVPSGFKRSLNLSLDLRDKDQRLRGFRTLNLLNAHEDPSFLRAVLTSEISSNYLPIARANFVRVVINGESWGLYTSLEQFNSDFIRDRFDTEKGTRWKVPGSPMGQGGLVDLGDDPDAYRGTYSIRSNDKESAWKALATLCRTLANTPAEDLEKALAPMLDIEGTLRFLALENVLVNNDGFWARASDYNLYLDPAGVFHMIPHDINETFGHEGGPGPGGPRRGTPEGRDFPPLEDRFPNGGPDGPDVEPGGDFPRRGFPGDRPLGRGGFPGGPGMMRHGGPDLDPLVASEDSQKPLLSKLLAVPALRDRYLVLVHDIAEKWLDWENLGPLVRRHATLINKDVRDDTRKLDSYEDFQKATSESSVPVERSLQGFAAKRRNYLLTHPEVIRAFTAGQLEPSPETGKDE